MVSGRAAADVLVAGAGIIGCSIAWECARRGARVMLVDRGRAAAGASGVAAGMLTPLSESHAPGPFLDLGLRALAEWPDFAAGVEEAGGGDCELTLGGLLRVALDSADAAEVRARIDWQRAAGAEASWVDSELLPELEPALTSGVGGAALYPAEGHVHPRHSVAALIAALTAARGEVHEEAAVAGVDPAGGVRVAGGPSVRCGCVVVAAGCWSGEVCERLDVEPPDIRPVRGQVIALRGVVAPRHVLFGGPTGYALARRDGTVLIGATEEDAGFDAGVTVSATAQLRRVAARLVLGAASAELAGAWAGLRPRSADGLPVVAEVDPGGDGRPRVLVATGHHRNGVLLAPVTARAVADLVGC